MIVVLYNQYIIVAMLSLIYYMTLYIFILYDHQAGHFMWSIILCR